MGNSLVFADFEESTGPGNAVDFFHSLKIKWIKVFFGRVQENMLSGIDINDTHETLKWREYFRLFSEIKEKVEAENEVIRKSSWHCATLGYEMIKRVDDNRIQEVVEERSIPDDHTDDDLSEDEVDEEASAPKVAESVGDAAEAATTGEQENSVHDSNSRPSSEIKSAEGTPAPDAVRSSVRSIKANNWNPAFVNPIFFGYTTLTSKQKLIDESIETEKLKVAEKRAIETAKATRASIIDTLEKSAKVQETSRLKRIADLEDKYDVARKRREDELTKSRQELSGMAFRLYKDQWERDYDAAEAAFEEDVGIMRTIHAEKTKVDKLSIRGKREDLEAFKDAEAQELPAAERLEDIARIEMARWIDTVDKAGAELDKARSNYNTVREELEAKQASAVGKANAKAIMELRSMVNIAETSVRECQRDLEEALDRLLDAEILLKRAIRMRKQQDELLPLFALLADKEESGALPSQCRLDYFAASMVIIMNGTFEQKCNLFLGIFDKAGDGFFDSKFLVKVVSLFQETLYRMNYVPCCVSVEEVQNTTERQFSDLGLHVKTDALSHYESRQFFITMITRTAALAGIFGFKELGRTMGTYQRNRMSSIGLLSRGIIGPGVCKYRIHFDMLKARPQLQLQQKQVIHERAMMMGADDPLRADYTRFLQKPKKKKKNTIELLYHGYLSNADYVEFRQKTDAATLIQSVFRSYQERRIAELEARRQAFLEAKEFAMREMRDKVVREFRKREGGSGVGKMKWDAQVRMRQAKARVNGQVLTRADMVMVMMEETIDKAKLEIEARFLKIEEKEAFKGVSFEKKELPVEESLAQLDVSALFGMVFRPTVQDSDIVIDSIATPRAEADEMKEEGVVEPEDDDNPAATAAKNAKEYALTTVSKKKSQQMVEGKYEFDPHAKGETATETELRLMLFGAEPAHHHLLNRLRALHGAMTLLKSTGMLNELPAKRLLVRYFEKNDFVMLVKEMTEHFRFTRAVDVIIQLFRCVVATDVERGLFIRELRSIQRLVEVGVRNMVTEELKVFVADLDENVQRRVETDENAREDLVIISELERIEGNHQRFRNLASEMLDNIDLLRERFRRVRMSCLEAERKKRGALKLKEIKEDNIGDLEIVVEDRQSWIKRIYYAIRMKTLPLTQEEQRFQLILRRGQITASKLDISYVDETTALVNKYSEIRSVTLEFLDIARSDAMVIVKEYFHPKFKKSIPVVSERMVHGRALECGRGFEGKAYTFEAHNIVYTVCEDYNGVFNGSDEYAAKAAGKDRLASLEYFKTYVPKLNVPLTATIDYAGFRVLAVAKLPIERVMYADDGEVRKISEEQVHGILHDGDLYINKGKVAQSMLKNAASQLNLAQHHCKGFKDIASSVTYGACDLKVYRGPQEQYYIKEFSRAIPPEMPSATPHLFPGPRDQTVLWRQLRPEFLKHYPKELSPDACSPIVATCSDRNEHYENLRAATEHLVQKLIPEVTAMLAARDFVIPVSEGLGLDLSKELHTRGVNVRHLGLMRSILWRPLPGTVNIYFHEQFVRTSRDLREEIREGDYIRVEGKDYLVKESKELKMTARTIPIAEKYYGTSRNRTTAMVGRLSSAKNSDSLRSVMLGEMIARTLKNIIRLHLRNYAQKEKAVSSTMTSSIVCEYLNIITGASARANHALQEIVYEGVRERFGRYALLPSERMCLQALMQPCIVLIVKRLQSMLGLQLSISCVGEFNERPVCFAFSPLDIIEISPIVRHNVPLLAYSDAVLLTEKAKQTDKETYKEQVLMDKPVIFLRLTERKGARTAENYKGTLLAAFEKEFAAGAAVEASAAGGGAGAGVGIDDSRAAMQDAVKRAAAHGSYSFHCDLEHPGPITNDPFSRSVRFNAGVKACIETRFHPLAVPQGLHDHFSCEVFCKCLGGQDQTRCVLMNGRYAIMASRENYWTVMIMQDMYELPMRVWPVEIGKWTYIVCTYDGTTLRCYIDAVLRMSVETDAPMKMRIQDFADDIAAQKADLKKQEHDDRVLVKDKTTSFAEQYFVTKEGVFAMKKASQAIMESADFQDLNIGAGAKDEMTSVKLRRQEALKQAKTKYATDLYVKNVQEVAARFKMKNDELDDKVTKQKDDGEMRTRKGLRVGAALSSGGSKDGKNFFVGDVSNVSVYNTCLPADRIRAHYYSAVGDKTKDTQRLYAEASAKYEDALFFAPDDSMVMTGYANSLCEYLKVEQTGITAPGISRGKLKTLAAIDQFREWNIAAGIAEIIMALPHDVEFADIVCHGFRAIRKIDPIFFTRGKSSLTRRELTLLARTFSLDEPSNPREVLEVAALMYQETVKDMELRFSYGEIDLKWLVDLQSPELVVALVHHACEVGNLKVVKVGEIFREAGHVSISINDFDVEALALNLLEAVAFDLSGCSTMTDVAMKALGRLRDVKILNLDDCNLITDKGLKELTPLAERLQVLSLAGLTQISDQGLLKLATECNSLTTLSLNNCKNLTSEIIHLFVKHNKFLTTLRLAATFITDDALSHLATVLPKKTLTSLDLSFCRDIADFGLISLSESCPNLRFLNLCGLSRITDEGARHLCSKLWYLQELNLEDMFLLNDEAFWFDSTFDGRPAADENMLKSLVTLNLRDCVNISNHALQGLAERCRKLERLIIRGCDKISDAVVPLIIDPYHDAKQVPMVDSLKTFDAAFCPKLSVAGMRKLLPVCGVLEELDLSGMVGINDGFIHEMCMVCPTIQRLRIQKCVQITDAALCSLADYMWIEELDITGCYKITDEGLEVLAVACNGLHRVILRRVAKVTGRTLYTFARFCRALREVDVRDCPLVTSLAIEDFKRKLYSTKLQN